MRAGCELARGRVSASLRRQTRLSRLASTLRPAPQPLAHLCHAPAMVRLRTRTLGFFLRAPVRTIRVRLRARNTRSLCSTCSARALAHPCWAGECKSFELARPERSDALARSTLMPCSSACRPR